jgi:hypothetical protein
MTFPRLAAAVIPRLFIKRALARQKFSARATLFYPGAAEEMAGAVTGTTGAFSKPVFRRPGDFERVY